MCTKVFLFLYNLYIINISVTTVCRSVDRQLQQVRTCSRRQVDVIRDCILKITVRHEYMCAAVLCNKSTFLQALDILILI